MSHSLAVEWFATEVLVVRCGGGYGARADGWTTIARRCVDARWTASYPTKEGPRGAGPPYRRRGWRGGGVELWSKWASSQLDFSRGTLASSRRPQRAAHGGLRRRSILKRRPTGTLHGNANGKNPLISRLKLNQDPGALAKDEVHDRSELRRSYLGFYGNYLTRMQTGGGSELL